MDYDFNPEERRRRCAPSGLLLVLAVLVGWLSVTDGPARAVSTTSARAATFTYDAPTVARGHSHEARDAEVSPAQSEGSSQVSVSLSPQARGASSTPIPGVVATNAVGGLSDDVARLAESNITASGDTVLGSYPGYITKANSRGASYFDIGDTWNTLTPAQRTAANNHFLDVISARGDRVLLSTPKTQIQAGTALADEIAYLTSEKGYVWANQWSLRPGG